MPDNYDYDENPADYLKAEVDSLKAKLAEGEAPKGSSNSHPSKQGNDSADPITNNPENAGFPE